MPRLESADQSDPLVLSLIAQTHEKLGNSARATEFYRKVLAVNTHDPANAAARPLAASKIASIKR